MLPDIETIKGIHPGIIIARELKNRRLKKKDLALFIDEHAQTISAIIKEKRSINPKLSIKLGKYLGIEPDYFMMLQAGYDVKQAQETETGKLTPDVSKIRKILFWDTDFDTIDWQKNKRAIIQRIFERGNNLEIKEIIRFYGLKTVNHELSQIKENYLPALIKNHEKYLSQP